MSEVMTQGILRMPPELWMNGHPIDTIQRYNAYVAAADRLLELERENAKLHRDRQMLQWLLDNCASFVTVDNTTGEPEIYIVEATREALNAELEKDM